MYANALDLEALFFYILKIDEVKENNLRNPSVIFFYIKCKITTEALNITSWVLCLFKYLIFMLIDPCRCSWGGCKGKS